MATEQTLEDMARTISKLHRRAQKDEGAARRLDVMRANMEGQIAVQVGRARYAELEAVQQRSAILKAAWSTQRPFVFNEHGSFRFDAVELVRDMGAEIVAYRDMGFWKRLKFLFGIA